MRRPGRTWLLIVGMVVLAVVGFAASPVLYRDRAVADVSNEALRRLKSQHTLAYDGLRPIYLQVTEARMTGPTPDHVEGKVMFRTLFGIPVGERYDLDVRRWAGVWSLFLGIEAALGAIVVRQSRTG